MSRHNGPRANLNALDDDPEINRLAEELKAGYERRNGHIPPSLRMPQAGPGELACPQCGASLPAEYNSVKVNGETVSLDCGGSPKCLICGADVSNATRLPTFISAGQLINDNPTLRRPVIHGLLREGEVGNIVSAPKTHKTHSMMALALSIATGQRWLNFQCEQGEVLYLDFELHEPTFANRLPKIALAMGLHSNQWDSRLVVDCMRGRLVDIYSLAPYIKSIKPGRFKCVILDSLYRCWPRDMNENDNACITAVYNKLDEYAQHLQACIVVVHHASKGLQSEKAVTDVGSGGGAQSRAADAHIVLRPHEEDGAVVLDAVVRSFAPVEPLCLRWEYPVWQLAPDLDPADLQPPRRKKRRDDEPTEPKPEPWTLERFVRSFITTEPSDQKAILAKAQLAGVSGRQASQFITLAAGDGQIHKWTFKGNAVYWATEEQPVTASESLDETHTHTHAHPPHPPVGRKRPLGRGVDACTNSAQEANT